MSTSAAICSASACQVPSVFASDTAPIPGRPVHQGMSRLAQKAPTQKNTSTSPMRRLPPPTVNRVPEAQAPPVCMPIPKIRAPKAIERLTGATAPVTPWPKTSPAASTGANSSMAATSMTICAVTPEISPSRMARR